MQPEQSERLRQVLTRQAEWKTLKAQRKDMERDELQAQRKDIANIAVRKLL